MEDSVITGAIIGGIIGGVGALIGFIKKKKSGESNPTPKKPSFKQQFITGIFLGIGIVSAILFTEKNSLGKIEMSLEKNLSEELKSKFYQMKKHETMALVNRGIKRLDDEDLLIWNKVRLRMAETDEGVCAGFWSGIMSEEMVVDALKSLPESTQVEWGEISARAANAEYSNKSYYKATQEEWDQGLNELSLNVGEIESAKLNTALQKGENATNKEGCEAMLTLMHFINESNSPKRINIVRFLAQLTSR